MQEGPRTLFGQKVPESLLDESGGLDVMVPGIASNPKPPLGFKKRQTIASYGIDPDNPYEFKGITQEREFYTHLALAPRKLSKDNVQYILDKQDIRGDLDFVSTDLRIATNDLSVSSTNLNISNKVNTNIRSGELDLVTQFGMRTSHGTGLEIKTNVLENQVWNAQTYNPERTYYKGETVIFGTQFYRALTQNIVPNTPGVKVPPAPGPNWELIPPVVAKTVHGDLKIDTNVAGPMPGNIDIHAKGKINATSN